MNASVTSQIMPKHSLENFTTINWNTLDIQCTQLRFYKKKRSDIRAHRWQWKIKEDSVQDDQQKYEEPWRQTDATF